LPTVNKNILIEPPIVDGNASIASGNSGIDIIDNPNARKRRTLGQKGGPPSNNSRMNDANS
jgi:hypothetical protein